MSNKVIHSTFSDFVLFLYVHMANADGEYHPKEHDVILEKMSKLFPEADHQKHLDKAIAEYNSIDKSELKELIKHTFEKFSSIKFSQKYKVYRDMFDIIHADGKVDERETVAINELKAIIDLNATTH
jgi:uncharacterized tellurite resistance protein B-like protein